MEKVRLALPNKGRMAGDILDLLADAGLKMQASGDDRALVASLGTEIEAIFVRTSDIPEFVADGAADVGVTGWNLVMESGRELDSLLDLEFGRCRLVVAAHNESQIEDLDDITEAPRVATSFPHLTRRFFDDIDRKITIVPVSGAAEIAPHLGIADIVVDLTSTGSTMRVNNLHEVATVMESTARLIGSPNRAFEAEVMGSGRQKQQILNELVAALSSVARARGKRYIMANVSKAVLEQVKAVLPGISGPTVIDILDGKGTHVAVHAVVSQDSVYRTIADLKMLGAEGILVSRIERLMP